MLRSPIEITVVLGTGCGASSSALASSVEIPPVPVQIVKRAPDCEAHRVKQAARADRVKEQSSESRFEASIREFSERLEGELTEVGAHVLVGLGLFL